MDNIVKLNNVRLSYPALFTASQGPDQNSKPSFQAAFILDKVRNAADIAAIRKAIAVVVREKFKGKTPPKVCLREGIEKDGTDGYGAHVMFINARRATRPMVVDQQKGALTEQDGRIYAGCYVNATITVWGQDNKFGKRVNAQLRAVQLVRDGKPFGEGHVDADTEFDEVDEAAVSAPDDSDAI
jgi:hypothetical protein